MRVMSFEIDGEPHLFVTDGERWATLGAVALDDLLREDGGVARLTAALAAATADGGPPDGARPLAPLARPGKLLFVGVNYRDHIEEASPEHRAEPSEPFVFAKLASAIIGPGAAIVLPPGAESHVDYEAELAVVIGSRCRNVAQESALNHVFGYTIVNDVSEREVQLARGQLVLGKGADTFCPMGPAVVLADALGDPGALGIWTRVNGELRQDSTTSAMLFGVAEILATISALVTLEPGDVVATGTPAGVGAFRTPPTFLQAGDTVTIGIEGIGELTNPVVAAPAP